METWRRHMPAGMMLKSDGFASSLSEPSGAGTLAKYCAERGIPYHPTDIPVRLDVFTEYALEFQRRFVPDLEDRQVVSLDKTASGFTVKLDDGETLEPELVVAAVGISYFARVPDELAHLPATLVTHSSAHHDLSRFVGRDVAVIGAGSSAVDLATLLSEAGARPSLIARADTVRFASPPTGGPRTLVQRIRRPSTGLGPGWRSWLCQNVPALFRLLPGDTRLTVIRRHLGPASGYPMRARFDAGVQTYLGHTIEQANAEGRRVRLVLRGADGTRREMHTDHVVAATGYWPDVERIDFLSDGLRSGIRTHSRMPVLSRGFESSVPGLYFVGPPAVNSFGPLMRFMVGSEYAAPVVARRLVRQYRRATAGTA